MWIVAGGLTAACILSFAAVSVESLSRADGCDYAQIARELTEGRGFSSRQAIYLLHLRFLKEHNLVEPALARAAQDPGFAALFPHQHEFPDGSIFYYRSDKPGGQSP